MKRILWIGAIGILILLNGCSSKSAEAIAYSPVATSSHIINNQITLSEKIGVSRVNQVFDKLYKEPTKLLGILINEPSNAIKGEVLSLDEYMENDCDEGILVIPQFNNSKITIKKVEFKGGQLEAGQEVYTKEQTEEGYGLYIRTIRPEGIPNLILTIEYDNKKVEYMIMSNQKDGDPDMEYLVVQNDEGLPKVEDDYERIEATGENDYLDGFIQYDCYKWDYDQDGSKETIELYCMAPQDGSGNPILDDGQAWAIVARDGDKLYPLFDKQYVQIGQVEYTCFESYDDSTLHVLIEVVQTAGMITYDCQYNKEEKNFKRKVTNEFNNTNTIHEWRMPKS